MSEGKKIIGVDYGSRQWHMHDGEEYNTAKPDALLATAVEKYGSNITLVIERAHAIPRPGDSENLSHPWSRDQCEEFITAADAAGIEVRLSSPRQTSKFRRVCGIVEKKDENDANAIALAMKDNKNFRHLHVMRPGFSEVSSASEEGFVTHREFVVQVGQNIEFIKKSDKEHPNPKNRRSTKVRNGQDYVLELAHHWLENTSLKGCQTGVSHNQHSADWLLGKCGDSPNPANEYTITADMTDKEIKEMLRDVVTIVYRPGMHALELREFMWRLFVRKLVTTDRNGKKFHEVGNPYITHPLGVAACVIDPICGTRMKLGGGIPGARKIYETCFSGSDNHGMRGVARSGKQYWFMRLVIDNSLMKACGLVPKPKPKPDGKGDDKSSDEKTEESKKSLELFDAPTGKDTKHWLKGKFLQPMNSVAREITRRIISEMIAMQPAVEATVWGDVADSNADDSEVDDSADQPNLPGFK